MSCSHALLKIKIATSVRTVGTTTDTMKCNYMNTSRGCQHGCTADWIKCHSFFDERGCEYIGEAKCSRGWHFHTPQEYQNSKRKREGAASSRARPSQVSISSDGSAASASPKKRPKVLPASQEPPWPKEGKAPKGPTASKETPSSVAQAKLDIHVATLQMDILKFESKSIADIERAYLIIQTRLIQEKAPTKQLIETTKSFHVLMKRRTGSVEATENICEDDSDTSS